MAASHAAIAGSQESLRKVGRALLSVSDKSGLLDLAKFLGEQSVHILSTGGTASKMREAGVAVTDVAEHTGSPEILDGRVKTLHPKIHGGILGVRGNDKHEAEMKEHDVAPIDLVVLNLYPFTATVAKGHDFPTCVENVDIGGPAMLRASAKNHAAVVIITSPTQYAELMEEMKANDGSTTMEFRKKCAAAAFAQSAAYDAAIAAYFAGQLGEEPALHVRPYAVQRPLKYGCNPHQKPAAIASLGADGKMPFDVLNGNPGYINLLDACNAWQLVHALRGATGLAAATSFKHVSPAGAAVAVPLTDLEMQAYEVTAEKAAAYSPAALAYVRARNADPMSRFVDFIAISDVVDESAAMVIKGAVSDGIIAPGYDAKALEILSAKKGGNYVVLQADPAFEADALEFREVFGMCFMQKRNSEPFTADLLDDVVTGKGAAAGGGGEEAKDAAAAAAAAALPEAARRDLVLASIALKFTQSNSVGYALNGMMVGIGAGQQSRVDCVKLAGRKVNTWYLRQHPKVLALPFKAGVKKQARVNARVRYIEGDFTPVEYATWKEQFDTEPEPLTAEERRAFMDGLEGVALASDAFFPFRDSIDHASKLGVTFVAQPGGSVQDAGVIAACEEYGMSMAFTKMRLFHH